MIFCSSSLGALASYDNTSVSPAIIDAIEHVIESIAFEKEHYGFAGVDLTEIMVGPEIPAYEAINGDLKPLSEITYYPIFDSQGNVVSLAAIKYYGGQALAFLSSELTSIIDEHNNVGSIALVYDQYGVYCWDTESIELIALNKFEDGIEYRDELQSIASSELQAINTEPVIAVAEMCISYPGIAPMGFDDEAAYVSAPVKRQPDNTSWCWAACMASIVQLETGDFHNCALMAQRYTSDYDYRPTINRVRTWLADDFGLDYSVEGDGSYLTSILNTLGHGHAVFGGFSSGGVGHASIIRGVNFGDKTFSVMDPQDDSADYLTGQIVNSYGNYGSMAYVQFVSGGTMILNEYLYM